MSRPTDAKLNSMTTWISCDTNEFSPRPEYNITALVYCVFFQSLSVQSATEFLSGQKKPSRAPTYLLGIQYEAKLTPPVSFLSLLDIIDFMTTHDKIKPTHFSFPPHLFLSYLDGTALPSGLPGESCCSRGDTRNRPENSDQRKNRANPERGKSQI